MPASTVPIRAVTAVQDRGGLRYARLPALGIALCAAAVVFALWPDARAGKHMLLHVFVMSAVAPAIVTCLRRFGGAWHGGATQLWLATLLQLAVFLYWHSPSGMMVAMHARGGGVLLQCTLLAAALHFWWRVAGLAPARAWHAIAALLVTGKLFCLVAVILTFAPRPLYHMMTLADQQLAGLVMITLCPLTYIASALYLCRRWLLRFDAREAAAT